MSGATAGTTRSLRAEHACLARAVRLRDRHVPRAGGRVRRHGDLPGGGAVGARVEPGRRGLLVISRAQDDAVRARGDSARGGDGDADLLAGLRDVGRDVDDARGVSIDRQAERERLLLRAKDLDRRVPVGSRPRPRRRPRTDRRCASRRRPAGAFHVTSASPRSSVVTVVGEAVGGDA